MLFFFIEKHNYKCRRPRKNVTIINKSPNLRIFSHVTFNLIYFFCFLIAISSNIPSIHLKYF